MKVRTWVRDLLLTLLILAVSFAVVVALQRAFDTVAVAPMVFVMAVFLVSRVTNGYVWGIAATLISVLGGQFCLHISLLSVQFLSPPEKRVLRSRDAVRRRDDQRPDDQPQGTGARGARRSVARRCAPTCCAPSPHDLRTPLTSI